MAWVDLEHVRILAEALGIGLLVGIERYHSRTEGEKRFAGIRTFSALGLLGGIAALLAQPAFTVVIFIPLAALLVISYFRRTTDAVGGTTEITGLVVFWLGYLVRDYEALAIGVAIILTLLLASKRNLHDFVRRTLNEEELFAALKLLVVVLVVYPLLPDRAMGPYEFFNPSRVWLLVIVVGAISFAGYVLMRWLGQSRGLRISALLGGIVSTTATTMALAVRSREAPECSGQLATAAVAANAVQFPRVLLLVYVVDPGLGARLLLPCIVAAAAGLAGGWWAARRIAREEPAMDLGVSNPFALIPAFKYAAFFVAVLFVLRLAETFAGESGVYLTSVLAGAANVSTVALSVAGLVSAGSLDAGAGVLALLLAVGANALTKWLVALVNGTRLLAWWLGGGLALMLCLGFVLAWLA
jgi:uncharacterized membrane protein (DUF4010 family)